MTLFCNVCVILSVSDSEIGRINGNLLEENVRKIPGNSELKRIAISRRFDLTDLIQSAEFLVQYFFFETTTFIESFIIPIRLTNQRTLQKTEYYHLLYLLLYFPCSVHQHLF